MKNTTFKKWIGMESSRSAKIASPPSESFIHKPSSLTGSRNGLIRIAPVSLNPTTGAVYFGQTLHQILVNAASYSTSRLGVA